MNKKEIKINFKYFWRSFDPHDNFFTNLLKKKYNVTISDKPNYLFYSVYQEVKEVKGWSKKGDFIQKISPNTYIFARKTYARIQKILGKNKMTVPHGNFVKIFYGAEHVRPNMAECDWAFGSNFEEDVKNPKYMRLLPHLLNDYPLKLLGNPPLKNNTSFSKIKKEKTKFCNFIYSQDIYKRNEFFKMLNKYKRVDAPGRCMNNMPPITSEDPKKSRLSKNWSVDKLKFIRPYKFTIAFENFSAPGWVTEKLTHPMIVNSIPIYFGHEKVGKDFNTKSFINGNDFKNVDELIGHIINVDNDDELYGNYLKQPWYKDNKYSKDIHINSNRILKRFTEIFG